MKRKIFSLTNKRVELLSNWFRSIYINSSENFNKLHVLRNKYCKIVVRCEKKSTAKLIYQDLKHIWHMCAEY